MRITMWSPFQESGFPSVDLIDTGDKFVIMALLPGMKREDIDISVVRNRVTLTGERKRESLENANYIRRERGYGSFHKIVELPIPIQKENISAQYKDGILIIQLPKEPFTGPINISID